MLALPAHAGSLGKWLFHHWCGIDKDLHLGAVRLEDITGERL